MLLSSPGIKFMKTSLPLRFALAFGCGCSVILTNQAAHANSKINFSNSQFSSYRCDVKTSSGKTDQVGLIAIFDQMTIIASGNKFETPRIIIQTLHEGRQGPLQPLVRGPIDEIVSSGLSKLTISSANFGYQLNQSVGQAMPVSEFSATPTPLDFNSGAFSLKLNFPAGIQNVDVQITNSTEASKSFSLFVKESGIYLFGNQAEVVPVDFSFAGICTRVEDNRELGF